MTAKVRKMAKGQANAAEQPAAIWVATADLALWAKNPRNNSAAIAEVVKSIKRFGFGAPIVRNSRTGEVIAGHTRIAAALKIGMTPVPVRDLDLSPAEAHALALADNKLGEIATWDDAALADVLREIAEADESLLADTGFSEEDLARLLGETVPEVVPEGDDGAPAIDESAPPVSQLGEMFELGPHRLVCGDSTDAEVVGRLMGGELADCVWTDPPYGVSQSTDHLREWDGGKKRDRAAHGIENDDLSEDDLTEFLRKAFAAALAVTVAGGAWYVAAPPGPLFLCFCIPLKALGIWRQTLNWVKSSMVLGRSDYHYRHESIFYGWNPAGAHKWTADRCQTTVLEFDKPQRNGEHPTMKPIALIEYCIGNNTVTGDKVFDGFGGSGSTLIACAQTGRVARLIEIDPRYCDVIRKRYTRWAKANGREVGSGALDG